MKESRLKTLLLNDLRKNKWWAKKLVPLGNAGLPDILAHKNGVFWGIELKQANNVEQLQNRFTRIQDYARKEILASGGRFLLLGSSRDGTIIGLYWWPREPNHPNTINAKSYKEFFQKFLEEVDQND